MMTTHGGIEFILKNLKVKNLIIGLQYEKYENCMEFLEIAKEKNINVIIVKSGDILKIDKYTYFQILAPFEDNMISENAINNNSIVAKFMYGKTSILFTGDIEEEAEELLIDKYDKNLNSTILKAAHHGSGSSSIDEFINLVNPKIVLIGVGEGNTYGHPSNNVIKRFETIRI